MGKEDTVLQDSLAALLQYEQPEIIRTSTYVREMFANRALPELAAWHRWHEPANNCGELTLFFQ